VKQDDYTPGWEGFEWGKDGLEALGMVVEMLGHYARKLGGKPPAGITGS
jgi:hypothetical protein